MRLNLSQCIRLLVEFKGMHVWVLPHVHALLIGYWLRVVVADAQCSSTPGKTEDGSGRADVRTILRRTYAT